MAKYGERISGRPSYQSHRQNYSSSSSPSSSSSCRASRSVGDEGTAEGSAAASRRDPVYPRSLQEEVLWRQRRFAWWGTTYVADPVSIRPDQHQSAIRSRLLQKILNRDVRPAQQYLALCRRIAFHDGTFFLLLPTTKYFLCILLKNIVSKLLLLFALSRECWCRRSTRDARA